MNLNHSLLIFGPGPSLETLMIITSSIHIVKMTNVGYRLSVVTRRHFLSPGCNLTGHDVTSDRCYLVINVSKVLKKVQDSQFDKEGTILCRHKMLLKH